ncbi:MAG TPA: LysM peptidoglycan-binding domain-containing protein, partial [Phnomibacter sp.]|nr:LysM peptidoglycan-binding domain-containing protein [Phnomibacter sp.]
ATPELSTPANAPAQTTAANNLADQQTLVQATPDNVHLQRTVADTRIQPYPDGVFAINGLKVVFAKKGSSLLALAARHGITMGQLLQFNEMARQDILDQDQLVFLERKKKTGSAKEHEVQPGETIWSISQQYGMQSNQLMNLNNLVSNISLQVGMKLQLQ